MKNRSRVTRGHGLLENFLARARVKQADKLIGDIDRTGRILDIGCGKLPLFLTEIKFDQKYGVDREISDSGIVCHPELDSGSRKIPKPFGFAQGERVRNDNQVGTSSEKNMHLIGLDIVRERLPFKNNFFDAVVMLAVLEHIETKKIEKVLSEVRRVLKPGGKLIITTPAFWTERLLGFMARVGLVSDIEISDHKNSFYPWQIVEILESAGFSKNKIRWGFFELYANTWVVAKK